MADYYGWYIILIHLPYLKNELESANDACNIFTWNNILNTLKKFIIRQETPNIRITINYLSLLPWIVNLFAVFNTQSGSIYTCVSTLRTFLIRNAFVAICRRIESSGE